MLLKIVQAGDDTLYRNARKLSITQLKTAKIQLLIDLMIATLRDKPGVGLAAPQVGEALQIIVIEDKKQYQEKLSEEMLTYQKRRPVGLTVIINPTITILDAGEEYFFEGCLSVEGYRAVVPRAKHVTISGLDRDGASIVIDADGWLARIAQHEVDHLSGDLYIDKMYVKSFIAEKYFSNNWADPDPLKMNEYVNALRSIGE